MDILFPKVIRSEQFDEWQLKAQLEQLYHEWHAAKVAKEPDVGIENVRFEHDPDWRNRAFSIQSAHDGNHLIWKATKVFWLLGGGTL